MRQGRVQRAACRDKVGLHIVKACLLSALCTLPSALPHLWAAAGTEGASFLNIPVGAGPAAMGSAYTSLATDAYATVYNPAGLGFLNSTQVAGQHLTYVGTVHYEYLGAVHPLRAGSGLGVSVQYLGSGDITETDINGNVLGDFSASYASYNIAYGQAISEQLSVGATLKWIRAKLSDVTANAKGGDLGVIYKLTPKWTAASTLTNIGQQLTFLGDGDNLPLAWHVATAYRPINPVLLAGDIAYRRSGPSSTHLGLEWQVLPYACWRVGYRTDTTAEQSQLAGFTTGVGLHLWGHEFGYAWVPLGELGSTQYFSLVLRFGEAAASKRNLIRFERMKKHKAASGSYERYKSEPEQLMELLNEGENHRLRNAEAPATPTPAWK